MTRIVKNRLILSFENMFPVKLYTDVYLLWLGYPFHDYYATLTFNKIMYRFAIDFDCDHQSYRIQALEGVYLSAPSVDFRPKGPENGEKYLADALTQLLEISFQIKDDESGYPSKLIPETKKNIGNFLQKFFQNKDWSTVLTAVCKEPDQ